MPYPTTLILLAIVGAVFGLGWAGTIDGAAVTSIYGAIVSGVLVGHYVKTTPTNGHLPPGGTITTTTTSPAAAETVVESASAKAEREVEL